MQTWKIQLPVLRSWSFGFAIPKLELGNQKKPVLSLSKGDARGCVSGALVANAGNACSRLRSKSLIPAYAYGDEVLYLRGEALSSGSQVPAWELLQNLIVGSDEKYGTRHFRLQKCIFR
jgi:hypothetical protein